MHFFTQSSNSSQNFCFALFCMFVTGFCYMTAMQWTIIHCNKEPLLCYCSSFTPDLTSGTPMYHIAQGFEKWPSTVLVNRQAP